MNFGEAARQQAQYRKGVLLGLTVAEALLLILFALMLAMAIVLTNKQTLISTLEGRASALSAQLNEAKARVEILQALADGETTDAFVKEVALARQQTALVEKEKKAIARLQQELQRDQALVAALKGQTDPAKRMKELASLGAKLESETAEKHPKLDKDKLFDLLPAALDYAEAANAANRDSLDAKAALAEAGRVTRENATLKGQVARYRSELAKIGKGGEYPPCWVTEAGEIQYIFDIGLHADGTMSVRDITPAARILDRKELPIPSSLFNGSVSPSAFLAMTASLFAYSEKHQCRFVVIARDNTGPSQKDLFKRLLLTVEGHFYKSLRR